VPAVVRFMPQGIVLHRLRRQANRSLGPYSQEDQGKALNGVLLASDLTAEGFSHKQALPGGVSPKMSESAADLAQFYLL